MTLQEIFGYVIIFGVCGLASYKIIKMWWPTFQQRKNLSTPELIDHAINAPQIARMRLRTMYGTPKQTLTVRLVNVAMLVLTLCAISFSETLLYVIFVYVFVGFLTIKAKGMPTSVDTTKFGFYDRWNLKLFFAWQWPVLLLQ